MTTSRAQLEPQTNSCLPQDDISTVNTIVMPTTTTTTRTKPPITLFNDDSNSPFLVEFGQNDAQDPRNFPTWRKWQIVLISMSLQMWANVISSIYAFGVPLVAKEFGVSLTAARVPSAIYLFGFALGPVLLAPFSEDFGRYPILATTFLVLGLSQIACAFAPNLGVLILFRFIGGFSGAATFNSIGTVSDLWNSDEQGWAVNCFALFAEFGATLGPVLGGFLAMHLDWRWIFRVSAIVCGFLLLPFLVLVPETRSGVLLTKRAKQIRKQTRDNRYFAMHERIRSQHTPSALAREMVIRPIYMLFTEPIVTWFAIFDGVNYAVIYIFLEAYPLIFKEYGFNEGQQGLAFIGIFIGFAIGFCLYSVQERWYTRACHRTSSQERLPEYRLLWGMPGGLFFPISLFFFAWTSFPPIPWIVPVLAGTLFGVSSHILFLVASDYVVASYTIFAASAVAAQSLLRELLSGAFTLITEPMYHNLGNRWASSLLAFIGVPLALIPFVLYYYGPAIRARSSFAEEIAQAERQQSLLRNKHDERDREREKELVGGGQSLP